MTAGRILLDSNTVIHFFNGNAATMQLLETADELFLCPPVLSELIYGAMQSRRAQDNLAKIDKFSQRCHVLCIDEVTAACFARIRMDLRQIGRPIPVNDMWIAAAGIQHDLPIATADAHFTAVPNLQVVSW